MTELSDNIKRLAIDGKSYNQIKEELGCSKGTISYHLGVGQREKTRGRTRDSRNKITKYIQEVKQAAKCADCGENYPYWIMEFDHLGDKLFTIGQRNGRSTSLDTIKVEIAKCEIVCANCHRNRTHYRKVRGGGDIMDLTDIYN